MSDEETDDDGGPDQHPDAGPDQLPDEDEVSDLLEGMSDPTRMEIVFVLIDAMEHGQDPLSFSTLRERVGERDSGKFNYHLDALCETLVEQSEDGYRMNPDYIHPSPEELRETDETDFDEFDPDAMATAGELIAHDLRRAIIEELGDHQVANPDDDALPFSELRERVGERDSGKFNYHLDALAGDFVERTDEGYRLLDDPGPEGFTFDPEAAPGSDATGGTPSSDADGNVDTAPTDADGNRDTAPTDAEEND